MDGTGEAGCITKKSVAPGPLSTTIQPTSLTPERYYRTLKEANGTPRRLRKEKAEVILPWTADISKTNSRYYLRFHLRLDPTFEAPPTDYHFCILMQLWMSVSRYHPPLELTALPEKGGKVPFRLLAEDDPGVSQNGAGGSRVT
jgi:hypothetical protein